jgi:mono/diheme cytochrome c family protein
VDDVEWNRRSVQHPGWVVRVVFLGWCALSMIGAMSLPLGAQTSSDEANSRGQGIYDVRCVRCHGVQGKGDGPERRFSRHDQPA